MRRVRRAGRKCQRAKRAKLLKVLNAAVAVAQARYEDAGPASKAAEFSLPSDDTTRPRIVSDLVLSPEQRTYTDRGSCQNEAISPCTGPSEIQIPAEDRCQEILKENHESAYAGHKGITKTYSQLKRLTDTPGRAFDKVSLDIVGPLPLTPDGFQYILAMQDLLTKYSVAAPLKGIGAIDTADAFIENLICRFGAPKAILTDQGSNFTSALMEEVAKRFKISHTQATAFHPQTNGSIERSHMVLAEYLKQFVKGNDWNKWLNLVMLSYNTSLHEGTNFTPHELVFGHLANVPTADATHYNLTNETYNDYLRNLQTKLIHVQSQARENLLRAKERSKRDTTTIE